MWRQKRTAEVGCVATRFLRAPPVNVYFWRMVFCLGRFNPLNFLLPDHAPLRTGASLPPRARQCPQFTSPGAAATWPRWSSSESLCRQCLRPPAAPKTPTSPCPSTAAARWGPNACFRRDSVHGLRVVATNPLTKGTSANRLLCVEFHQVGLSSRCPAR